MKYPLTAADARKLSRTLYGQDPSEDVMKLISAAYEMANRAYEDGRRDALAEQASEQKGGEGVNISYEDAVKAMNSLDTADMLAISAIYEAHFRDHPGWGEVGAMAVVFAAGRIDGVRQERARRRRKEGVTV